MPASVPVLSDAEKEASRVAALERRPPGPLWVFGYGSIMWDPRFEAGETRVGTLCDHRRAFCFWTLISRGTHERPGLGLGLEQASGARCTGLAFSVPPAEEEAVSRALWQREMYSGIYRPDWVPVETDAGALTALTFVAEPDHPQYAGGFTADVQAEIIAGATGKNGPCAEYLALMVESLAACGVDDPAVTDLHTRVQARLGAA